MGHNLQDVVLIIKNMISLLKKKKKVVLKDILLFVLDLLNLNGSFNFLRYTLIVHLKLCVKRRIVSVGFHKALRHTH